MSQRENYGAVETVTRYLTETPHDLPSEEVLHAARVIVRRQREAERAGHGVRLSPYMLSLLGIDDAAL